MDPLFVNTLIYAFIKCENINDHNLYFIIKIYFKYLFFYLFVIFSLLIKVLPQWGLTKSIVE